MKSMGIGLGVTVPIEGIPVTFDGNYDSESDRVSAYQKTISKRVQK